MKIRIKLIKENWDMPKHDDWATKKQNADESLRKRYAASNATKVAYNKTEEGKDISWANKIFKQVVSQDAVREKELRAGERNQWGDFSSKGTPLIVLFRDRPKLLEEPFRQYIKLCFSNNSTNNRHFEFILEVLNAAAKNTEPYDRLQTNENLVPLMKILGAEASKVSSLPYLISFLKPILQFAPAEISFGLKTILEQLKAPKNIELYLQIQRVLYTSPYAEKLRPVLRELDMLAFPMKKKDMKKISSVKQRQSAEHMQLPLSHISAEEERRDRSPVYGKEDEEPNENLVFGKSKLSESRRRRL